MNQSFGRYQLVKKLATGGMAEVFLARQTGIEGFDRHVVIKRILPHLSEDPEFVQMFLNEAKIAARFNHPNIAQIYDLGEEGGTFFIAMEFIHGEDLGRVMRKAWSTGQWIARPLAVRIVANACEGLYYAHVKSDEQGRPLRVVHRDISPQNILIGFDGSVKLVDFGIAKASDQASMTKSGAIKGKFAYMSPEQAAGKPLDHRSDIFAIGLVLYELLTGVRPLKRDSELATLQAALECAIDTPSQVADVPSDLDSVVMKALCKASDDRYRDARAFQMALEELLVSQRWVASSVQVSDLMTTLFADRLKEEERLGAPNPVTREGAPSGTPMRPPPSDEAEAFTDKGTQQTSPSQEWEAPPAVENRPERSDRRPGPGGTRTGSSHGLAKRYGRKQTDDQVPRADPPRRQTGTSHPPPDVPEWDAPPSLEIDAKPVRAGVTNETALARTPSRSNLPRQTPSLPRAPAVSVSDAPELTRDAPPDEERREPSIRPSRTGSSSSVRRAPDPPSRRETLDREPSHGEGRAPRRNTRPSSVGLIPVADAAPRKTSFRGTATSVAAEPEPALPEQQPSDLPARVDVTGLRERASGRFKTLAGGLVLGALIVLGLLFRQQIAETLSHTAAQEGILLTVTSDPKVRVKVRHPVAEGARQLETDLGETPLEAARGAHVRDVLVYYNDERGIHYEEELRFGEPNKVLRKERRFVKGKLRLTGVPKGLTGLTVHRGQYESWTVGNVAIDLYEGKHTLEVRQSRRGDGLELKAPYVFDVEIKPGKDTVKQLDLKVGAAAPQ